MGPFTLNAAEAAEMLGVSRWLVHKLANQPDAAGECWLVPGKVRIIRSGRRVLVPRKELEALLAGPDEQPAAGVSFS